MFLTVMLAGGYPLVTEGAVARLVADAGLVDLNVAGRAARMLQRAAREEAAQGAFTARNIELLVKLARRRPFDDGFNLCLADALLSLAKKMASALILHELGFHSYILTIIEKVPLSEQFLLFCILEQMTFNLPKRNVISSVLEPGLPALQKLSQLLLQYPGKK